MWNGSNPQNLVNFIALKGSKNCRGKFLGNVEEKTCSLPSLYPPTEHGPPHPALLEHLGRKGSLWLVTWLGKGCNCKKPVISPRVGRPGNKHRSVKEVTGSMAARDQEPWLKPVPTDPIRRSIVGSTERCGAYDIRWRQTPSQENWRQELH